MRRKLAKVIRIQGKMRQLWVGMFVLMATPMVLLAQQHLISIPPFQAVQSNLEGTMLLNGLSEEIPIPVYSKAGRGLPFTYQLIYSPNIWIGTPNGSWVPTNDWGWQGTQPTSAQYLGASTGGEITYSSQVGGPCVYGNYPNFQYWYWTQYTDFTYYDPQGEAHSMNGYEFINNPSPPCGPSTSSPEHNVLTDNSGLTITISLTNNGTYALQAQVQTRGGKILDPEFLNLNNTSQTESTVYDRNGNEITATQSSGFPTTWTDTLGQTALSATGSGTASSPLVFNWNNANNQQESVTVNYQNYNIHTNFGCSGISEYSASSVPLVSSIVLADGSKYVFSYESTPGYSGDVTGRLASITLPSGGTVSYSWGSPDCSASGQITSLTRTLPDGQKWQYSENFGTENTITVTDPNNNQTVYSVGGDLDKIQSYEGSSSSGTLLQTKEYCYNTTATAPGNAMPSCTSSSGTGEVSSLDTYTELGNQQSESAVTFDSLGNVTEADNYDFKANVIGNEIRSMITSLDSFSNSYGSFEEPATVETTTGGTSGTLLSKTSYTYDQSALTASGATQLVNVGSARGNPTTITYETNTSGPATLSKTFTYYDTGMVDTATGVNGRSTSFSYGCNGAFSTQINLPLSQSVSYAYNCIGGVVTSATDFNGNQTTISYGSDPYWRALSITDPLSNTVNNTYTAVAGSNTQASTESSLSFNSSSSTVDQMVTFDNQGRPEFSQVRQAPGSSYFDSVQTLYSNANSLWTEQSTIPYVGTLAASGPSTYSSTTNFDALGRPNQTVSGSGGTLSYTYNDNDVLETAASPTIAKQLQYDAIGRLTSVCEITSNLPGNSGCGQNYSETGLLTTYAYDTSGQINYGVTENAQDTTNDETRTFIYDMLGRLTSESNPENGTTNYYYDSTPSGSACGSYTSAGDLVESVDAAGNVTCYQYDTDHRVTEISYSATNNFTASPTKYFVYDSASLNGTVMANAKGRLAEAYTALSGSTQTTEYFSYDKDGNLTDVWESTPNSGGYDHVSASYWANGLPNQLSVPGVPTITYTPDGEGRVSGVSANGTNLLSSVSYAIGASNLVTTLTYGSGDSDTATMSLASGEPTQYQFDINGSTDTSNLTWNSNGTLSSLDITDQLNSSDTQNCTFAYDDLGRLGANSSGSAGVSCGSNWTQDFSFDSFGNISTSGSLSFQPSSYNNQNRIQGWSLNGQSIAYNNDGDLTSDPFHTYGWFASNELESVDSTTLVRDALGRVVEIDGSTKQEVLYAPFGGKIALMSGSSLTTAWIPLANGAEAVYNSSGLAYYRHPDWLGSSRLASTQQRGVYFDTAYSPYGAAYDSSGTTDLDFTGHNSLITSPSSSEVLSDFMFREYSPLQGRWIQPDPAGLAAVNPVDPQSWNRYAYVGNNPNNSTDPLGLCDFSYSFTSGPQCNQGNSELDQAYNIYSKWMQAMDTYGAAANSYGTTFTLQWSLISGVYWAGPNGENVSNDIGELGLPNLSNSNTNSSNNSFNSTPSYDIANGSNGDGVNSKFILCTGIARVICCGLLGHSGSLFNDTVTAGSAAIIPTQWSSGTVKEAELALNPFKQDVWGVIGPIGRPMATFVTITDAIGPQSTWPVLERNNNNLIVELEKGIADLGTQNIIVNAPMALGCPAGTR